MLFYFFHEHPKNHSLCINRNKNLMYTINRQIYIKKKFKSSFYKPSYEQKQEQADMSISQYLLFSAISDKQRTRQDKTHGAILTIQLMDSHHNTIFI